jgi:iron complex outermembrane receptor protein
LGGTDWTLIPLERIERIEVVRGGRGSILYGDNASGGVVNIITKEGEKFNAEGKIAAGSYDTFKGQGAISGSWGDILYALSGSYLNSDGYRDNSQTEAKDVGMNLAYYVKDAFRLHFSSSYHEDKTGLPGSLKESDLTQGISKTTSLYPMDFADVEDYYFKGGPELFFMNESILKMDLSYRKRNSVSFASFTDGSFEGDTEIETIAVSPQIVMKEKISGFDNSLIIGFDYSDTCERIENESVFFGFPSSTVYKLSKKGYGYYFHDEFGITDNLAVSGGYRYEQGKFTFTPSTPDHVTLDENLYTAGVNYGYRDRSSFYFNFARSFRFPVFDEMFSFFTNTLDTTIRPQTSDGYEIGLKHSFSETLGANINFFHSDTTDEIFYNSVSFANENLDGRNRRRGVEIAMTKTFESIALHGNYTYMDATIESGQYAGNKFPNIPEHNAAFDAQFTFGTGLVLGISGVYVGERPFVSDFTNAHSNQDAYFVANAKLTYQWQQFTMYADFNNITDTDYSEYGGIDWTGEKGFYPSPRFNFLFGVRAYY